MTNSADMFFATARDLQITQGDLATLDPYAMPLGAPMNPAVHVAFAMQNLARHHAVGAFARAPRGLFDCLRGLPSSVVGGMDYVGGDNDFTDSGSDPSPGSQFDQGNGDGGFPIFDPNSNPPAPPGTFGPPAQGFGDFITSDPSDDVPVLPSDPGPFGPPAPAPNPVGPAPAPAPQQTSPALPSTGMSKTKMLIAGALAVGVVAVVATSKKKKKH